MFTSFWEPAHKWKPFIIMRKVQNTFPLQNNLVTFNNICVWFKNTTKNIRCITILEPKFFNQNLSIKSLKNSSKIVGSLIDLCFKILRLDIFQVLIWRVFLSIEKVLYLSCLNSSKILSSWLRF